MSSEHAGGVEKVTVSYDAAHLTTTVQDASGATNLYAYSTSFGVAHTTSATRSCPDCTPNTRTIRYDSNGNRVSDTDFNGNVTTYTYDTTRNLETSRTEAAGKPEARTISTQWHATFRLPIKITSPDSVKTFDYNAQGLLIKHADSSPDGTRSRVWTYTYNTNGQITQVDGSRTDVADVIRYSYDAQGHLTRITDAMGLVTQITRYDVAGHPLTIIDPNGLTTTLSYDSRGRIIAQDKDGEVTRYAYDKTGALQTLIQVDNTRINYSYDTAHRLIGIQNSRGDQLTYTLDATGHRLREDWQNPSGTVTKTLQRQYDGYARLGQELGAQGQTTAYHYDNNDNVSQITDPLQRVTHYRYDALDRLIQDTDPTGATVSYSYDADDRALQVNDRNNNATRYVYDGLGNRIQQNSPDTGSIITRYDSAGNVIQRTDANGQTTAYQYDANNRLIQTRFAEGTQITYQYDTANNGSGHLAKIIDSSGSIEWEYDRHGRISSKQQTIALTNNRGNRTLITRYRYNSAGQLTDTLYPSGLTASYGYTNGDLTSLKLNGKPWLNNIRYQPDNSIASWTWADGSQQQRNYDQDGQLTSQTLGTNKRTLNHDNAGNITAIIDTQSTLNLGYDAADRLIAANNQHWQYDKNSNRIQQQDSKGTTVYNIDPASNHLQSSNGANFQTYRRDANGNTLQANNHSYRYDAQNRLIAVDNGRTAQYRYNALGQRIYKQTPTNTLLFAYDETGKLIGEYNTNGTAQQETFWLGNLPVAVVKNNTPYALHTDHLGTPRVITDAQRREIWRWNSDPFGTTPANEDPDRDGVAFTYNLRFAGQYYDPETGLHYNYFRDYDPKTGGYLESDPIGLRGGLNTYSYVGGNPLSNIDPFGLTSLYYYAASQILSVYPEQSGQSSYYLIATSGRPDCTECDATTLNQGPIPNGNYTLNTQDISNPNTTGDLIRNLPGIGADWGDWRVPLTPNEKTNTFGRSGFFLHGGSIKGSAGCIDVGGGVFGNSSTNQLLNDIKHDPDGIIPLIVK